MTCRLMTDPSLRLRFLVLLGFFWFSSPAAAFSLSPSGGGGGGSSNNNDSSRSPVDDEGDHRVATPVVSTARRDLLWKIPLLGVGTVAYSNALLSVARPRIVFPLDHERHVSATIATALECAARSRGASPADGEAPLRVLEVGIGKDCRLIRRGLYDRGLQSILSGSDGKVQQVEITGVDLQPPSGVALQEARQHLASLVSNRQSSSPLQVNVQVSRRSITEPLGVSDGYFDCVVCCLTLCSVDDPGRAADEVNRVLRPDGGTFGYVEHVAVDPEEPYRFLELQQTALDPLQQVLADNCHLHRYTEGTIAAVFRPPRAVQVAHERFLVKDMWPVTCQCCGVYQKVGLS